MQTSAMESPIRARIPAASREDLSASDSSEAIERAVLAFALSAAFQGRIDVLEHLRARLGDDALADSIQGSARQLLDALAGEGSQSAGAAAITRRVAASDVDPDGLLVATVRFLEFVRGSMFVAVLTPMLARWARQSWKNAIKNQRFHLRAPNATVPGIEAALDAAGEDLGTVARIALAAEPAVRQQLSSELRAQLRDMV